MIFFFLTINKMVNKNFMVSKTGRGLYITPFGMLRRALHSVKRGSGSALLLSPGLGASDGGVKIGGQLQPYEKEKQVMETVQKRLQDLTVRSSKKKKNISFKI